MLKQLLATIITNQFTIFKELIYLSNSTTTQFNTGILKVSKTKNIFSKFRKKTLLSKTVKVMKRKLQNCPKLTTETT